MCHRIIRYSEQILVQRPARLPQLLRQRKAWQRSLEKVPAGRDVLYNSDMVTLTALLSQQIGKTVAFTSINAGFMISPPPPSLSCFSFYSPRLPLIVRVTASLRDNYWDVLVQLSFIDELDWSLDTLCWCMALALSFFSHLYSSEAHHRTPGIIHIEFSTSDLIRNLHLFLCLYEFSSPLFFFPSSAAVPKDPNPQWRKVAWSHDCTLLAYADSTGTVRLFDLMGSELFVIPPVTTPVCPLWRHRTTPFPP